MTDTIFVFLDKSLETYLLYIIMKWKARDHPSSATCTTTVRAVSLYIEAAGAAGKSTLDPQNKRGEQ